MTDRLIYCDGVSGLAITGNMVRIDLTSISPTQREPNNRPVIEFRGQIVMPPEAFLQAIGLIQKFVQELKEKSLPAQIPQQKKVASSS